ncbi:unnamed protein product [Allacma fusca]|uniref:BTB domain-containing protein n=1 Tax=Allacma fusca TaxID=39272 RepID=A0A8J2KTI3_9HEXA|nr:unnamed protein product [Allacma fusca]
MSGLSSTVFSTATPPLWNDCIVLDVEDLDGILNHGKTYRCVPLVVQRPYPRDKLTWSVSVGLGGKKNLRVRVDVSIAGFKGINCTAVTTMSRGGYKYSGEPHQVVGDGSKKMFQDLFNRDSCYVVPNKIKKGGLLRLTINIINILSGNLVLPTEIPDFQTDFPGDCGSDLFKNPFFSDVIIKCEDRIFPAHKMILALRSPVFAKMFEVPMTEALNCKVVIDDVKASTCEHLLKYLYTGKIETTDYLDPEELLYCAEKYDIESMKTVSIRLMKSLLSEENAGEFNLAVQKCCVDEATKSYFRKYCRERHSSLIEKEEYKNIFLQNVELFV